MQDGEPHYVQHVASEFLIRIKQTLKAEGETGTTARIGEDILDWIDRGDAIDLTGGDYSFFLMVVIHIMTRLQCDPILWEDVVPESPFFDFSENIPECLQRERWDAAVFRRKYPPRQQA